MVMFLASWRKSWEHLKASAVKRLVPDASMVTTLVMPAEANLSSQTTFTNLSHQAKVNGAKGPTLRMLVT